MKDKNTAANITIRPIEINDNEAVANIIRGVMTEFSAVGEGYSINDPEVSDMYQAYSIAGAAFYVVEKNGSVLGCAGFAPLTGGENDTCELRKMYFLPELRGTGIGSRLLKLCLDQARKVGFKCCYLETLEAMNKARNLYQQHGFEYLDSPMGSTGHTACGTWMAKQL